MPKIVPPLTDSRIRAIKPKAKKYNVTDGQGLFLLISTHGTKSWRFQYRLNGKQQVITLGTYPEITLLRARELRLEKRTMVANDINPRHEQIAFKNKNKTLNAIATEWINHITEDKHYNKKYVETIEGRIKLHVLPFIGRKNINAITPLDIVQVLKSVQRKGIIDTAHRLFNILDRLWKYAVTYEKADRNILQDISKKDILHRLPTKHYPSITDLEGVGRLLIELDLYDGSEVVRLALKLMPHVFLRPYNIRFAEWSEIDFDNKIWVIPAHKMKMREEHTIPLTPQVIEILQEVKGLKNRSKYLFPSPHTSLRPISENTLNVALRRIGYSKEEIVSHSFRHMASTLLHENMHVHGFSSDVIEKQLAHQERNKIKKAYNSAQHLENRVELMNWWSSFLTDLHTTR